MLLLSQLQVFLQRPLVLPLVHPLVPLLQRLPQLREPPRPQAHGGSAGAAGEAGPSDADPEDASADAAVGLLAGASASRVEGEEDAEAEADPYGPDVRVSLGDELVDETELLRRVLEGLVQVTIMQCKVG